MTHGTSGMRKGISLVEMMIAIVLLGVLSVIGYKYYKNFFDTDLVAKKAQMGTVVDQASQLSSAYDVYQQQFGTAPTAIANLTAPDAQILKALPTMPTSMTTALTGWSLSLLAISGVTPALVNDTAFVLPLDGTASDLDKKKYCRVFNNMMDKTQSLADDTSFGVVTPAAQFTAYGDAFCYNSGTAIAPALKIVFVKNVDAS